VLLAQHLHGQSRGCLCFVFVFKTIKPQNIRRIFLLEAILYPLNYTGLFREDHIVWPTV